MANKTLICPDRSSLAQTTSHQADTDLDIFDQIRYKLVIVIISCCCCCYLYEVGYVSLKSTWLWTFYHKSYSPIVWIPGPHVWSPVGPGSHLMNQPTPAEEKIESESEADQIIFRRGHLPSGDDVWWLWQSRTWCVIHCNFHIINRSIHGQPELRPGRSRGGAYKHSGYFYKH